MSSSFGAVDLAGFPKAGARWFQAWWLYRGAEGPGTAEGRPPLPDGHLVHIVESPDSALEDSAPPTFHVYTDAASAELFADGISLGKQSPSWLGYLSYTSTSPSPSNLTAVAYAADGSIVAHHERLEAGAPAALRLTLDVPHVSTATGSAVVSDGHDVALVRAAVVDSRGRVVHTATNNITFRVTEGPGRILGVGNGDPSCHEPNQVAWRSAYHGLARGIVKVTLDSASPANSRATMLEVDVDGARGRVEVADPSSGAPTPGHITVTASSPGLGHALLKVPVSASTDSDGVLASARSHLHSPVSLE